jgi:hypothetical protein
MKLGTRYCDSCEYQHGDYRDKHPSQRVCARWPTVSGFGFVDFNHHNDPPFRRCREINVDGCCPMFKEERGKQMEIVE